jgi:hypothetical protein
VSSKIQQYAEYVVSIVRDRNRPCNDLKWWVFNNLHEDANPYSVEIYLAGINILKAEGIEKSKNKRKPLTTLSKADRAVMRKRTREVAEMLQAVIGSPCVVSSKPIKRDEKDYYLQLNVSHAESSKSYIYLGQKFLASWENMPALEKRIRVQSYVESRFKSADQRLAENIEIHRANLESLI